MELRMKPLKWQSINWKRAHLRCAKLQRKIYEFSLKNELTKVHIYQDMLLKSSSAKLIAVRSVTQDNRGKKTAGVDGKKSLGVNERLNMAKGLKLDGKASPIRRVYIPKPGKTELRPLGIPTLQDRAKQTLAKLALEPQWEAQFEPNSYGFRPGRSCHDAIEAIHQSIYGTQKGKYVLDADIAKCVGTIDHDKLISKLESFPRLRRQIKAWLKAGVLDKEAYQATEQGTPQGGVISPLLSNIALHGMENHMKLWIVRQNVHYDNRKPMPPSVKPKGISLVRYAEDFVLLHKDKSIIQSGKQELAQWLNDHAGLSLSEAKTRLSHTDKTIGEDVGFDFLGFHVRRYAMSQYGDNKFGSGMKTLIKPSRKSVMAHKVKLRSVLRESASAEAVVSRLNPIIRGWCNYFRTVVSKKTFGNLRLYTYMCLLAWAQRKHRGRGKGYLYRKYFQKTKGLEYICQTNLGRW